jgi:hypothetical protein
MLVAIAAVWLMGTVRCMSATRRLLLLPFWLGVLLAALGYVITFIPGAECGWFLVVAGLSASGLFIPKTAYRVAAGLLVVLALGMAYSGYRHGLEYRQWLSTHRAETP